MQPSPMHRLTRSVTVGAGIVFLMASLAVAATQTPALPLLDAPINATWAANHSADWREKGFYGFFFEGLLDDLTLFPSEQDQRIHHDVITQTDDLRILPRPESGSGSSARGTPEQIVPGDWDALATELRGAVNRLKANGLDRNFLRLSIAPEAPYFTNPFLLTIAENRLHLAGSFCRRTGLRGIALDTQSMAMMYDYRWDGHPPDLSPEQLEAGARRFGKRILRAYIRAFPEGEILLLARTPELAAPLWFSLFEGALESAGAAETIPIRLVVYDDSAPDKPAAYLKRPERFHNLFRISLSRPANDRWSRQGGLAFSLEPVHYEHNIPAARHPLDVYRRALYAAALYGESYVVISAPNGGWWHIPPDTAAQFDHLHQKGRARVTFAPPVPRTLDAYAPRLKITDAVYIGSAPAAGTNVETLHNDKGAVLLAWNGLPEELRVPMRTGMVVATNLETDERHFHTPQAEEILISPRSGPHLLEGLPMRSYALPAAMQMRLCAPIIAGVTRTEIEIELYNPFALPLRGTLTLNADRGYGLGAATAAVNITPGESMMLRRTVQGISYMGNSPEFSMTLHTPAEAPLTRSFSFPVEPIETYRFRMNGPVPGTPALILRESGTTPLIIVGDVRGGLLCLNATSGNTLWHKHIRGNYMHPPLLLNRLEGVPYIATRNEHGRLRFYEISGEEKVVVYQTGASFGAMAAISVPDSKTSYLGAITDGGIISIYAASGELQNRIAQKGVIHHLISNPVIPGRFYVIASDSASTTKEARETTLAAYDLDAGLLWEHELPNPVSCTPVIHASHTHNYSLVCIGDEAGDIHCYDAGDGTLRSSLHGETNTPVTNLAVLDNPEAGSPLIAQTNKDALTLSALQWHSDNDMPSIHWTVPLARITALTALPENEGLVAGLADGSLYALGIDGRILWEEHRGAGAISGLTTYSDGAKRDTYCCAIATQAGLFRILEIRRTLIAPPNPQ